MYPKCELYSQIRRPESASDQVALRCPAFAQLCHLFSLATRNLRVSNDCHMKAMYSCKLSRIRNPSCFPPEGLNIEPWGQKGCTSTVVPPRAPASATEAKHMADDFRHLEIVLLKDFLISLLSGSKTPTLKAYVLAFGAPVGSQCSWHKHRRARTPSG